LGTKVPKTKKFQAAECEGVCCVLGDFFSGWSLVIDMRFSPEKHEGHAGAWPSVRGEFLLYFY